MSQPSFHAEPSTSAQASSPDIFPDNTAESAPTDDQPTNAVTLHVQAMHQPQTTQFQGPSDQLVRRTSMDTNVRSLSEDLKTLKDKAGALGVEAMAVKMLEQHMSECSVSTIKRQRITELLCDRGKTLEGENKLSRDENQQLKGELRHCREGFAVKRRELKEALHVMQHLNTLFGEWIGKALEKW
ncbi:hypothetical protein W97_07975 [Coniosporium apollinis CBS 100218]|uniref:Uncharacterized protein n=1 Tax=Coniosporium apollinis (strain CBS 100218) TaxID=1168221 RepID=R7Z3H8_CONA1|nr:uncharacterized protein W97_07975 [Coniosporium apollinis CBS 100218]EON68717.1 hypothetical protein W97_07975 [Coniosporium apollinis CBS 100218]